MYFEVVLNTSMKGYSSFQRTNERKRIFMLITVFKDFPVTTPFKTIFTTVLDDIISLYCRGAAICVTNSVVLYVAVFLLAILNLIFF